MTDDGLEYGMVSREDRRWEEGMMGAVRMGGRGR